MSNDWKEVIEEGQVSWWHETQGGVVKSGNKYVAEVPFVKVIKLGPFDTLEEAQEATSDHAKVHAAVEHGVAVLNEELIKK